MSETNNPPQAEESSNRSQEESNDLSQMERLRIFLRDAVHNLGGGFLFCWGVLFALVISRAVWHTLFETTGGNESFIHLDDRQPAQTLSLVYSVPTTMEVCPPLPPCPCTNQSSRLSAALRTIVQTLQGSATLGQTATSDGPHSPLFWEIVVFCVLFGICNYLYGTGRWPRRATAARRNRRRNIVLATMTASSSDTQQQQPQSQPRVAGPPNPTDPSGTNQPTQPSQPLMSAEGWQDYYIIPPPHPPQPQAPIAGPPNPAGSPGTNQPTQPSQPLVSTEGSQEYYIIHPPRQPQPQAPEATPPNPTDPSGTNQPTQTERSFARTIESSPYYINPSPRQPQPQAPVATSPNPTDPSGTTNQPTQTERSFVRSVGDLPLPSSQNPMGSVQQPTSYQQSGFQPSGGQSAQTFGDNGGSSQGAYSTGYPLLGRGSSSQDPSSKGKARFNEDPRA